MSHRIHYNSIYNQFLITNSMSFHNKINSTQQFPMKSCFPPIGPYDPYPAYPMVPRWSFRRQVTVACWASCRPPCASPLGPSIWGSSPWHCDGHEWFPQKKSYKLLMIGDGLPTLWWWEWLATDWVIEESAADDKSCLVACESCE